MNNHNALPTSRGAHSRVRKQGGALRTLLVAGALNAVAALGSPAAAAQPVYRFDLPAQPLAGMLRAIGRQTQLNILFDPQSVRHLMAVPLHGAFTATEAIDRVLAGTHLLESRTDSRSVLILPAAKSDAAGPATAPRPGTPSSPPKRSPAAASAGAPGADSGGHAPGRQAFAAAKDRRLQEVVVTTSYLEQRDSSMKLGIPVRDTPFSIESYTNSFMTSIETQQVADLYRYMTGLQKAGITGYALTIRGFSTTDTDRNTFLTDGLPGLAVRFGSPLTIGIDHIELVKGAASLLYGQATPGGFVNIITKKPRDEPSTELEARGTVNASGYSRVGGSDVSFDSTGPLGTDRVLYRVIGQVSDDRYFRNSSYARGKYLAPMVTVRLGEATTATAQFEYRSVDADYENAGLLAPYTPVAATVAQLAPIQTVYTAPGTSLNERGTTASFFLERDFAGGGSLHASLRSVDHHDYAYAFDAIGFDRLDPSSRTLDLRARGQSNQRTYNFGDLNGVLPFGTGGIRHRLIVGIDAGKEIDDFRRTRSCLINSPGKPLADPTCNIGTQQYTVSLYDPDFGAVPPPGAFGTGKLLNDYIVSQTAAGYLSDLLTLSPRWKALVGVRYSRDRLAADANRYDPALRQYRQVTGTTLPEAGIIYQPNDHWSYYASYSTSYTPIDPSTQTLTTVTALAPSSGRGGELGFKASFFQHRIDVTGAAFLIDQSNVLMPYAGGVDSLCPSGGCEVQVGAARSKGVELELDAKPTDALTLIAGYAFTDAFVTASDAAGPIVGGALPDSPRNAFHFWSRYDALRGPLRGFGAGLGFSYVGARVANTGTPALPGEFILPGYGVVDLGLYKQFANGLDATVKINNLFDRTYYQDGTITLGTVSVDAGAPRTAELYLTYTFLD